MRRSIALPALVAAALLVAWHGVILSLPHHHADLSVPQEKISCSASHPGSSVFHLHQAGRALTAHPCLACLAGSTFAVAWHGTPYAPAEAAVMGRLTTQQSRRAAFHAHLPDLRAPPTSVQV